MKTLQILILLSVVLFSCEPKEKSIQLNNTTQPADVQEVTLLKAAENKEALVLTTDALLLVDQITGSSNQLPFGMPQNQLIEIINNTFKSKPVSIGINPECGAGSLKMVKWNNGLTLVFQENNTKVVEPRADWQFEGWFINSPKEGSNNLTTMAGIGIGSTLAELHNAYEIEVKKTSLGQEFSTASGLFGILDGAGKNAKIIYLWSGVSCNFR
jgi:hypothetical protein